MPQADKRSILFSDAGILDTLPASKRIRPQYLFDARNAVLALQKKGDQGWLSVLDQRAYFKEIQQTAKRFSAYSHCVVLGIGGSDLGARAVLQALRFKNPERTVWFAGNTTDPDALEEIFSNVPWKQACINVISKSGGTLETMTAFALAKERLENAVGKKKAASRIVCTTDPEDGDLFRHAKGHGYALLAIPKNIGGRFSVLTAVGLFPLAYAGVDIASLLRGARSLKDRWVESEGTGHPVDQFSAWHAGHALVGRPMHVFFAYAEALGGIGQWWRQLWAESLGKSTACSPTPIVAVGPTDQHSQLQLYQDGPNDKVYTFLNVQRFSSGLRVPNQVTEFPAVSYAQGRSFQDLIHAASAGTAEALTAANRPVITLTLPALNPYYIGELLCFYELATAVTGVLLGINPYDQPGVEASKQQIKQRLKK